MAVQASRIAAERDAAEQARADLESVVDFQAGMLSATDPQAMGRRLMNDLRRRVEEAERTRTQAEEEVASSLASFEALTSGVSATDLALGLVDEDILGRAVSELEERFAEKPLIDARLRLTIGDAYRKLGRYERAEPQLKAALATRESVLGPDHPDTLSSMNALAVLYWSQGRYAEAEPLYLETLEREKRVLGADHPETLRYMNNLAALYVGQGRHAEAEPLLLETLATRKRVLGADDPDTLSSMNNLAGLYRSQGRYAEAEPLYLETLATRKRLLGGEHPQTLRSMSNLASLYASQGRYAEAEPLLLETLAARVRVLGDKHPQTAGTLYNLSCLEALRGDRPRAMDWLEQAVDAGLAVADHMARDPDLKSLHGPEFDALVERARENARKQQGK
ncbi:MAG: tetratricopeptide repeat protein [Gammaproteobacteria bacterium]|nr:tetratricopeptide repeat protein [Gammaproteobacteria bacterium]